MRHSIGIPDGHTPACQCRACHTMLAAIVAVDSKGNPFLSNGELDRLAARLAEEEREEKSDAA
jgi:hypothetical protein